MVFGVFFFERGGCGEGVAFAGGFWKIAVAGVVFWVVRTW